MVIPGILRRVNKSLPALIQTITIICFIHYIAKGILVKVQTKAREDYHVRNHLHAGRNGARTSGGRVGSPNALFLGSGTSSTANPISTTPPLPPFPDDVMEREQQRRLDTLQKACERMNIGLWASGQENNFTIEKSQAIAAVPKIPLYQALLVYEEKKLAVCPVVRTGSQWLSRRLLQLTGKFTKTQLYRLHEPPSAIARHNFPYLSSWEKYPVVLAESVTILMGRHPLDRLLASYRHLLEDPEKNPNGYLHYGKRIVRFCRKSPNPSKGPTFEEFIRYLLERDSHHLDEAWQPVIRRCTPCHIPYNIILHYETLWYDVQWAWKKAGIGPLNTTDYFIQSITPSIRRQYFSELTLAQVVALYKKYSIDFDIYGYSLEEHIAYAQPGEEVIDVVVMNSLPRQSQDILQRIMREEEGRAVMKKDEIGDTLNPHMESNSSDSSKMDLSLTGGRGSAEIPNNILASSQDYRKVSQIQENF